MTVNRDKTKFYIYYQMLRVEKRVDLTFMHFFLKRYKRQKWYHRGVHSNESVLFCFLLN